MIDEQPSEQKGAVCTGFHYGEYDEWSPCICPKCKGYLPENFPTTEGIQFQCKKCSTVLEIIIKVDKEEKEEYEKSFEPGEEIPEYDPTEGDYWGGRICIVPENLITIKKIDYAELRKTRPKSKRRTGEWAYGLGFSRAVWTDKEGDYIKINGTRLSIGDSRIKIITSDKNAEH